MMSFTKPRRKSNNKYRSSDYKFLLSAFSSVDKVQLAKDILWLGGKYYETLEYKNDCTHIVSGKPIRGEKYLCGCAAGKWVVTKDYITASREAGNWLDVTPYEWGYTVPRNCPCSVELLTAPKRWREKRAATGHGPFHNWTVMLFVQNVNNRPAVYKRLLEVGGATVLPPRLRLNDLDRLAQCLTHVFVDLSYENSIHAFQRRGVACLSPDYIAAVLCQHSTPDPAAFCVTTYVPPPTQVNCTASHTSSSSSTCSSSQRSTSSSINTSTSRSSSQTTSRGSQISSSITSSISTPTGKDFLEVPAKLLSEAVRKAIREEKEKEAFTPKQVKYSDGMTRDVLEIKDNIKDIILRVKKRKSEQSGPSFVPYCFEMLPLSPKIGKTCPVPFTLPMVNTIDALIEEGMWLPAVGCMQSYISSTSYPPPQLLHQVMKEMIQTDNIAISQGVYHLLKQTLCLHCPAVSPALRCMYLQSLSTTAYNERMLNMVVVGGEWDFVSAIIRNAIGMKTEKDDTKDFDDASDGENKDSSKNDIIYNKTNTRLLLRYLVALFEQDFLGILVRQRPLRGPISPLKCSSTRQCILSCLLWPSGYPTAISTAVITLLHYLVKAVKLATDDQNMTQILNMIQRMVAIAAECYQQVNVKLGFKKMSSIENEKDFANEVISAFTEGGLLDCSASISLLLETSQPSWLRMRLAECLLNSYDSSLVNVDNKPLLNKQLSLRRIVSCYFFLLPKLCWTVSDSCTQDNSEDDVENQKPKLKKPKPAKTEPLKTLAKANVCTSKGFQSRSLSQTRKRKSLLSPCTDENEPLAKKKHLQVNKRNYKGETQLHVACIKNNLAKVKELLACPGIDINAPDNAGWTPLHEACNHGNISIVKELLRFKPAQTITSFFTKGTKSGKNNKGGLDLLASPDCGTTVLHDAIFNGHIQIARLIVKAGGKPVLMARNKAGYSPLDCALSHEMKEVLQLNKQSDMDTSSQDSTSITTDSSQDSCPTDSEFQSVVAEELPSCDYAQILKPFGGKVWSCSTQKCDLYALIVYHLLKSYLRVSDLNLLHLELERSKSGELLMPLSSLLDPEISSPPSDTTQESIQCNLLPLLSSQITNVTASQSSTSSSQESCLSSAHKRKPTISERPVVILSDLNSNSIKAPYFMGCDEKAIAEDLVYFSQLGTFVQKFSDHLKIIGPGENLSGKCNRIVSDMEVLASMTGSL
ncbi:SMC5-SMC6 complex localization factor protein 1-like [Saccoglossus kowalevskii]|uniref:Ankyrin repeat domain-containing protein 32-like n=1 Tax=Saccoglossus kowalevskii TaxID=10224 RepID=A0ABM0GQD4_SACKO|nr:PREDICTED: ankyrin repeat domain-containing protein 32-like [Saccoglossus kowalevskii]